MEQRFTTGKFYAANFKCCSNPQNLCDLVGQYLILGRILSLFMVVYAGKVTLGGNTYLKVVYRAVIEVFEDYFVFFSF